MFIVIKNEMESRERAFRGLVLIVLDNQISMSYRFPVN